MKVVLMGFGINSALSPIGDGARSGGVLGREASEELVDVSHPEPPEDGLEEMSPSRARPSREEDLEDFPGSEEPPREEPPREDDKPDEPNGKKPLLKLCRTGLANACPTALVCVGGETAAASRGEVLTDPLGCWTCARTSFQAIRIPGRLGSVAMTSEDP